MVLFFSISDEAARKAQRLVRRLAAEKHRKAEINAHVMDKELTAASHNLAVNERCGRGDPGGTDRGAPAAQAGRRPWRVGAPSSRWTERR